MYFILSDLLVEQPTGLGCPVMLVVMVAGASAVGELAVASVNETFE